LIEADTPVSLDSFEAELIRKELGEPPNLCYPITAAKDRRERLVAFSTLHG
jgi:hypothetical protein